MAEQTETRSAQWRRAYPCELRQREFDLMALRPKCKKDDDTSSQETTQEASTDCEPKSGSTCGAAPDEGRGPQVALALSGGGIRSATFAFGFLQALAKRKSLTEVDLLSTVSGGGYTGGMLTRLFSREAVNSHEDVESAILPPGNEPDGRQSGDSASIRPGAVFAWLRENGNHLAPNGAGDLLLGGAVIFRNWLSVHFVLYTLFLAAFILLQIPRWYGLHLSDPTCDTNVAAAQGAWLTCHLPLGEHYLWWSPWLLLPVGVFVLGVLPTGLAYWLLTPVGRFGVSERVVGVALLLGSSVLALILLGHAHPWGTGIAFTVTVLAFVVYLVAECATRLGRCRGTTKWRQLLAAVPLAQVAWVVALPLVAVSVLSASGSPVQSTVVITLAFALLALAVYAVAEGAVSDAQPMDARMRLEMSQRLSAWLKCILLTFAVAFGLAIVDTFGQTLYAALINPHVSVGPTLAGALAALAALATGARRLAVRLGGGGSGRPRLRLKVVAAAAAIVIMVVTLTSLNALSHGLIWGFTYPHGVPSELWHSCETAEECPATRPCRDPAALAQVLCTPPCLTCGERADWDPVVYLALLTILSLLFGRSCRFLNDSTLQPLYRARLIRAYLGASNPERLDPRRPKPVTKMLEGDDVAVDWDRQSEFAANDPCRKYRNGAPLHLVNVTVNETVEKKTGLQRSDRRGIGMAVGPAGISAGVRHHLVFRSSALPDDNLPAHVFPDGGTACDRPFRMFAGNEPGSDVLYTGESLTLGQWIGISGAAFSTGIGYRTNFGIAFLAGMLNVRLGHWWRSGIDPSKRMVQKSVKDGPITRVYQYLFGVQSYLIDELIARFRGVHRKRWYLSDGGHFENLGGYELIRRRVPIILIVDAEADPDYRFEGLGNLVRRARADFDAEIEFLSSDKIAALQTEHRCMKYFGSLDMVRRGTRDNEAGASDEDNKGWPRRTFAATDRKRPSLAHAALATVRYEGCRTPTSLIVYVKPSLVGDEPADIAHYHEVHVDFPQQTTADQFFDEAQWESYRKLGELIGLRSLDAKMSFDQLRAVLRKLGGRESSDTVTK